MCTATKISKRKCLSALQPGCKKWWGQATCGAPSKTAKKNYLQTLVKVQLHKRTLEIERVYFVTATPIIHSHYNTPNQNGVRPLSQFLKPAPGSFSDTLQDFLVMPWTVMSSLLDVAGIASEYPTNWGSKFSYMSSIRGFETCWNVSHSVVSLVPWWTISKGQKENMADYKKKCKT